jgi:hypothetical protein
VLLLLFAEQGEAVDQGVGPTWFEAVTAAGEWVGAVSVASVGEWEGAELAAEPPEV